MYYPIWELFKLYFFNYSMVSLALCIALRCIDYVLNYM